MNTKTIILIAAMCVIANVIIVSNIKCAKDISNQIENMEVCAMQPVVSPNSIYISNSMVIIDSDGINVGNTYGTESSNIIQDTPKETQPIIETSYNDILTEEEIMLIASIVIGEAEGEA